MNRLHGIVVLAAVALIGAPACTRKHPPPQDGGTHEEPPAPTNRVDVPPPVRENLGITFARVESRAVARTLRVTGQFELLPDARREYRTMLDGRVELLVSQFDRVEVGTPLFRLDSPKWRQMQQELAGADSAILVARAAVETIGPLRAAHKIHEDALGETVGLWTERVAQLERLRDAGGGKADELSQARITLTTTRAEHADVMEKDAELEARNRNAVAELDAAKARFDILLSGAAVVLGTAPEKLGGPATSDPRSPPLWRTLGTVDVAATAPGIVDSIQFSNGAWADPASLVLTTAQPERVRFHAHALQSDLVHVQEHARATIAPPRRGAADLQDVLHGPVVLGVNAHATDRTFEIYVTPERHAPWAKPGVAAWLEITTEGGGESLAIPLSAVARDGLRRVFFRRDPKNPDVVIRVDADLAVDDGRWIVVKSGVREGDEVVLDGVYQLMLATSSSAAKGGHFHADGTFHADDHK